MKLLARKSLIVGRDVRKLISSGGWGERIAGNDRKTVHPMT
ncbi:MAG: hypothetical protein ACOYXT_11655 [Bacteroidota bacterium]